MFACKCNCRWWLVFPQQPPRIHQILSIMNQATSYHLFCSISSLSREIVGPPATPSLPYHSQKNLLKYWNRKGKVGPTPQSQGYSLPLKSMDEASDWWIFTPLGRGQSKCSASGEQKMERKWKKSFWIVWFSPPQKYYKITNLPMPTMSLFCSCVYW